MWSDMIALFQPGIDNDLRLSDCREPLGNQDFSSESTIEGFVVAVLPRTAGMDLDWLDACLLEPGLQITGNKLGAIVRANVMWLSMFKE